MERLNEGLHRKLTLVSAPAGFGKTTLVTAWYIALSERMQQKKQCAWLSLDEPDNDLTRFLTYFVAALQTLSPEIGQEISAALESPQPPPIEPILTTLLNEISNLPDDFVFVLDDYHVIDARPVDDALTFLLEHLPSQMHLVITTREDPRLPLARLRARGQLTELRAADLRFTPSEAAEFLNSVMGLNLSADDIVALEVRTEGWIAGLQLAALAMESNRTMQREQDNSRFIKSFSGSHHFVLDYLAEEVLQQQSTGVQTFLLSTSILERMCGPLCDAVLLAPVGSSQETLEHLERANLFLVPLDNERNWYRYHHLFADLLRQRLRLRLRRPETLNQGGDLSGAAGEHTSETELHKRASEWYEENGLEIEAFQHAAAANDVDRAERLIEGVGVPLHFRGAGVPVRNWLASQPKKVLDARPSLWLTYASSLMMSGQPSAVEEKLDAAEAALEGIELDEATRDLVGRIASMRATVAVIRHDVPALKMQSRRALEYLDPKNLPLRTAAHYTLGYAHQIEGDRKQAARAYAQVISDSKAFGPSIYTTAATLCLGQIQEAETELHLAVETYHQAILLVGDPPRSMGSEMYLGLARIFYEWNDLETAQTHGEQCVQLMRLTEGVDTFASYAVFDARLKLALGDADGAAAILDEAQEFVRRHNFAHKIPELAAAQVIVLLYRGQPDAALRFAEKYDIPISRARVHLARGNPSTALELLEPLRQQAEEKGWADEWLKIVILQALAYDAHGNKDQAIQRLRDALVLAEPGGLIRSFIDHGAPMGRLLYEALARGVEPEYVRRLLAALPAAAFEKKTPVPLKGPDSEFVEPLSAREVQVLELVAQGLTNQEIATKLYLSLHTVKVHARNIYAKLGVENRTQAAARAKALGLLS